MPPVSPKISGPDRFLWLSAGYVALVLFLAATARHLLFQSTALDLGWFDQAIYLISRGENPVVSFSGMHILGDHAALTVYPLALFYKLFPSVYWLLGIQALALAIAAWPLWYWGEGLGLNLGEKKVLIWIYFLYPLVFNLNLFDFHTEVLALPGLFWALWAVQGQRWGHYFSAVLLILASKAVLSLTVIFLGLWLLFWQKGKRVGAVTLALGVSWFLIASKVIIPQFSGKEVAAVGRYSYLGNSVGEILQNLVFKPQLFLGQVFTLDNAFYLLLLTLPVLWGLVPSTWRNWSLLIPAFPALFLNLITPYLPQKDLIHQYSLTIFPFLILLSITHYQQKRTWLRRPRWLLLWSIIAFLALAKFGYFGERYLSNWPQLPALRSAVSQIPPQASVLTAPNIAPHLSHRPQIQLAIRENEPFDLTRYEFILLNQANPAWENAQGTVDSLIATLRGRPDFKLVEENGPVVLFQRR
ncbi:MAG: DUF2079 domain-containing protein [Cyanobacteria bacterium RI_101]|nr:DUF2079 domain-containing protein [Cyanobacteria bacterium RI_101]